MDENIYLSIVLPVYNEENLIRSTISDISNYFEKRNFLYEIIAVDDGSIDKTQKILSDMGKTIKNMTVISCKNNLGKGFAVKKGMLFAKGKYRLFMDSDSSTDIKETDKFLKSLKEGADVAIGDRTHKDSIITVHQPFYKKILGKTGNVFIRIIGITRIKDTQCGFKCFKADFVDKIFPMLKMNRWAFDVEIIALAERFGYKLELVPIVWKNRTESRVRIIDYFTTLLDLLKIKIMLIKNKYEFNK